MKIIDIKNYGFVPTIISSDQYVLGGGQLPKIVLKEDGQWDEFLPQYEPQFNENYDTSGCVVWSIQNNLETTLKFLTGADYNFSERFNYILAGIRPPGSDPHHVSEIIRKYGMIEDYLLPFTSSFEEFIKPDPMTLDLLIKGREFPFEIGHEWVWTSSQTREQRMEKIKECLPYGLLCVSVTAWIFDDETETYIDNGIPNTHFCVLYGWNEKGWLIFDSYDQSKKVLSYDHNIQMCKRYQLKKNNITITQKLLPISLRRSGQKLLGVSFLVAHDTANAGTTARQNVDYYIKSANVMEASTHYFVDDKEIIQCIPDNEKAWQVRYSTTKDNEIYGKDANSSALGIELCFGGIINSEKAYQNYIQLLASLCQKYNLNPEKQIVGHYTLDPTRRNDPLDAFKFMNRTWTGFIFDVSSLVSKPTKDDLVKCEEELAINKTLLQKMWAYIIDILSKK